MTNRPPLLDPLAVPLDGCMLIEASAGTGKTHTITTLYLRLLLERGLKVEQILVVTFTNAATAELRERLRSRIALLLDAIEGKSVADAEVTALAHRRVQIDTQENDRRHLRAALYNFDLAPIHTIHSFCQRVLQQYAFEGGRAFSAELSSDSERWIEAAVSGYWLDAIERADENSPFLPPRSKASDDPIPGLLEQEARTALLELANWRVRCPDLQVLWPEGTTPKEKAWREFLQQGLDHVLQFLAQERRRRGVRSFDDLLQELREALRSPAGEGLADCVRRQFPAALIDEFQDTDPVQYEIFRRIYNGQDHCSLFLIGDPKQAIYAFRGADVFAYLRAKRDATGCYTLLQNHRSAAGLVRAVNTLFSQQAHPFLIDGIEFYASEPALRDVAGARLEIVWVPTPGKQSLTKQWAETNVPIKVAADIHDLVNGGTQFDGEKVTFSSIAILCRTNRQAAGVQQVLRKAGIPSALESESSVFDSPEAAELELILTALLQPTSTGRVRAALATSTLGRTAAEIVALDENDRAADDWAQRFFEWGESWRRGSVLQALQQMFEELQVIERLLLRIDGERCVTNLRHLGELLHQAAMEKRLPPEELLQWLATMRRVPALRSADRGLGEAQQLRLESDEQAVKIVTIHKSKGLQYPIVFCPFLWDNPNPNSKRFTLLHDPRAGDLVLDLRNPPAPQSLECATLEARAEARRLLYVALTRARYRCVVYWGAFTSAHESPLAGLLHPALEQSWIKSPPTRSRRAKLDDASIVRDLESLAAKSNGCILVRRAGSDVPHVVEVRGSSKREELTFRQPSRRFDEVRWQVASFSALSHGLHEGPWLADEGRDFDRVGQRLVEESLAPDDERGWWRALPAGARTGEWLHSLLEQLDFVKPVADQLEIIQRVLGEAQIPLAPKTLAQGLQTIIDTPLTGDLSLRQIPGCCRLSELDFLLSAGIGRGRGAGIVAQDFADAFATYAQSPMVRKYAEDVARLPFARWCGFLKGYIDLVFRHQERWYIVDYKSNDLGSAVDDYRPERLAAAMAAQHYVLQYHLYTVAVHRFLQWTRADYDYEKHFGGVFYLFLRGMSPRHPQGTGVYADRPPARLVAALAELFDGREKGI